MEKYLSLLNKLFSQYKEIKLVYLFGSRADNKSSPRSDYDFAVYFDEKTGSAKRFSIRLMLITELMKIFKTDKIDVVVLNDKLNPLLKYQVIRHGRIIFERKPFKLILEPSVYNEFFDYQIFSKYHNL